MTENYRPQSPDFSSLSQPTTSPFFNAYPHSRISQQYVPPYQHFEDMARRSSRIAQSDSQPIYDDPMPEAIQPIHEPIYAPVHEPLPVQHIPEPIAHIADAPKMEISTAGIEVKTKFPVARIKRIMQADEDVGKVAQVTPIAVSKALELFMISLVTKAAQEAKDRNSKRVTASHLKQAVAKDEVLDFLADIISKVPDQPAGRKNEDDGSDQNEGRRKRGGRRTKEESD
ncbi:uncharacterized protein N7529_010582 [Penicillium soppii]|uniref:uncharacterized protein n=1 Tax=Penicillium soppii TaxID=69789 RepID=UPI00254798E2|nr:uncharacterized protein N7529_010582 [Penicillium soppii]KAJ5856638.1 hypothetical protein N7529_010582 [Penicillium soppii]